jgi:hypothetical protein
MRRIPSRELGSYVLEVGGVIIGVVALIAGATDVAKIFQARSAVRAAVHEGTRCLYPTDADCVSAAPDFLTAPSRTFDVWVWGAGYQVERESYVASASWQQEPVLEVAVLRDEIVDVTLEQKQFQYRSYSVLYPVTSHTPYFLQTRYLPVVAGGDPFNPNFVDPFTRQRLLPNAKYSLSAISDSTKTRVTGKMSEFDSQLKIGSVSFAVSDAWPTAAQDIPRMATLPASVRQELACYSGATLVTSGGPRLNWGAPRSPCRYRVSQSNSSPVLVGGALKVPLMMRVTGSTRGTSDAGEGKVTLSMSWTSPTGGSGYKELGGRVFAHVTSGDFVPRGLALSDIDQSLRSDYDNYNRELEAYFELPLVPTDATVTLDLFLMSTNGRTVKWTGELLQVWYPQYSFVHERHDCGYSQNPYACPSPRAAVPSAYNALTEGALFQAVPQGSDSCSVVEESSAELDVGVVLNRLQGSAQQGVPPQPYSFRVKAPTDEAVCAPKVFTQQCSYQGEEYLQGCGREFSREQIARLCNVTAPPGALIGIKEHTTRTSALTAQRSRACSDVALPQCAKPHARQVETVRYFGGATCEAARTVTTQPLTVGPLYVNSCESRTTSIQEMYRRDQAIPNDVPVSVIRLPAAPVFSAEPPASSCVSHYPANGASAELLCGQGLSAYAAEECCKASNQRCRKQEVLGSSDPARKQGTELILTSAQRRVIDAVQVGYPPARPQAVCVSTDLDCLEVSAALVNDDTEAKVAAKVNVPLNFLHLVNGDLAVVRHESTRVLERMSFR